MNNHGATQESKNVQPSEAEQLKSAAVKDENTKKQLTSMKETKPGYYTFQSQTKAYEFLIPKNATLNTDLYERNQDIFENMEVVESTKNKVYIQKFLYQNQPKTEYMDIMLKTLSEMSGYKGEFTEQKTSKVTYYICKEPQLLNGSTGYAYLGYVKSNSSDKAVGFTYLISSKTSTKSSGLDFVKEKEKFLFSLKSIKFID